MPNHWHFAVTPKQVGDVSKFFKHLSQIFTQRWHKVHGSVGTGHLFQERFKCVPVMSDFYEQNLIRYIEANPLRAGLVSKSEVWKWGSLYLKLNHQSFSSLILCDSKETDLKNYLNLVNSVMPNDVRLKVKMSLHRLLPLGKLPEQGAEVC